MNQIRSFPNQMGRILLDAIEEILGSAGMIAALQYSGLTHRINSYPPDHNQTGYPFNELSSLLAGLENLYGPRAGHGIALRSGRAAFKIGLRSLGADLGLLEPGFRLQPIPQKIRTGTSLLADTLSEVSDQKVELIEFEKHYGFTVSHCPVCWQRQANQPICHLTVGFLQESLYWLSGGKYYDVQEISCSARGDPACIFHFPKQAGN